MVNKRLLRVGHNQVPAVDHRIRLHFPQGWDHVIIAVVVTAAAVVYLGNSWLIVTAAMLHALHT